MGLRVVVRSLLVVSLPVDAAIPAERWFGSRGIDGRPDRPFAEIRFGGNFRGMGPISQRRLEVWIHDDEGDYGRIEDWIGYTKRVLDGAEHVKDADGNELITCQWQSDSTDLYDDGYRTNCMSATFEVTGKDAT